MADELFIQDPDKHFEELPQPFAFINELVYSLLEASFEKYLIAERERAELSDLRKLSNRATKAISIQEDIVLVHIARVKLYSEESEEDRSMLVLATRTHLLYFPVSCSYQTQDPSFQYKLPVDSPIHDFNIISSSNRYSLLRCLDVNNRIEYHGLTPQNSYRICSIPDEDSYKVNATTETEAYIILTCAEEEEEIFMLVYTFPVTQWRDTLNVLVVSTEEEIESNFAKLTNFSKPILSAKICQPQPLHPSTFFSQSDLPALSDMKHYMNGISHTLSQEFFNNLTKCFNLRTGYTSTLITPSTIGIPLHQPHYNSVLSESAGKRDLAVWWEGGSDLYLYSISSPSKDLNVYPHSFMDLAGILCSSCVSSDGDILVLGYEGCVSIWKFPLRTLIKFLTIEDLVDLSPIQYLPNLGYPSSKNEFICVGGDKSYFLKVESTQNATLSLLNQSSDPNLPAVSYISQLAVSPTNNFILFYLASGVAVVRDVKAETSAIVTLLQPVDNNKYIYNCCYLSPTDRQLFLLVSDSTSDARKLVQYDLAAFVQKMIFHEMDAKPSSVPDPYLKKGCIHIPGNNTMRTTTIEFIKQVYANREATKEKARVIWDNLKSYLPPE